MPKRRQTLRPVDPATLDDRGVVSSLFQAIRHDPKLRAIGWLAERRTSHLPMKRLRQRSWSWVLKNVALPIGDAVLGQRMIQRLRFLEEAQWWDRERLYAHRDGCLRSLLKIAYHEVPLYRELMDRAGVRPEDIRSPSDLQKLPVVTKAMLRSGYPELTTRRTGQNTYEERTSGST